MSSESLCPNVSDAFANNDSITLQAISMENIDEVVATTTESDVIEEIGDNGADTFTKRNVKLWEINGVFYNLSEIQSFCEPVSF